MSSVSLAFLLLLFSGVLGILGIWQLAQSGAERRAIAARARPDPGPGRTRSLRLALGRRFRASRIGRGIEERLQLAGSDLSPFDFALLSAAAALTAFLVANALMSWWVAVLLGLAAVRGCLAWLDRKRAQRREEMIGQLPELARAMSNAVAAGLSTTAALELASRELQPPIADELRAVVGEARLGQSLNEALDRLASRVPSREIGVLVSTIVIQQRSGGDTVRALQDMSQTLEARKDLLREVRTIMAGSVFSGWIVVGLGVGTLLLMNLIRPGLLDVMTSNLLGVFTLCLVGGAYALGLVLVRRVTRVEL